MLVDRWSRAAQCRNDPNLPTPLKNIKTPRLIRAGLKNWTCHGSSKHTSIFRQVFKVEQFRNSIPFVGHLVDGEGGGSGLSCHSLPHLKGDYEPANYSAHSSRSD